MSRFDWTSFISNIIAVILGIFITFGIQGLVDRRQERNDVKSALGLVKQELLQNKSDLEELISILESERDAAHYLREHNDRLGDCTPDSLKSMTTTITTEMISTSTDDALELLKNSSLFQKIGDNNLALSIIQAYDYIGANSQAFNIHEKYKIGVVEKAMDDNHTLIFTGEDAEYMLSAVEGMVDTDFFLRGLLEIEHAISEIDEYLK